MSSSSSSAGPAQIVFWSPSQLATAQVETITLASVNPGAVITVTVGIAPNTATISYTAGTNNTTTEAAALQALLANATDPRFQEIGFVASTNTIICTAVTAGTPHTLAVAQQGGASISIAVTTPNTSPNDVADPANWNRNGVQQLPQNGDTVIVAESAVGMWWNLSALAAVQFATYTRWQTMSGTIGLPEVNAAGYTEYRPTYFQFSGPPGGVLQMVLGQGQTGGGPGRERYNVGNQKTTLTLVASGTPLDDYAVRFLGSNVLNVLNVFGSSLGVAMLPGETASIASAIVLNGASLALGPQVTITGALQVNGASAVLMCAPGSVLAQAGSSIVVQSAGGLTYPSITAKQGSQVSWLSDGNVTNLVLQTGSVFDKSADARPITVSTSVQDGDTTVVSDPWSAISWGSKITFTNAVQSGPVLVAAGRQVQF